MRHEIVKLDAAIEYLVSRGPYTWLRLEKTRHLRPIPSKAPTITSVPFQSLDILLVAISIFFKISIRFPLYKYEDSAKRNRGSS